MLEHTPLSLASFWIRLIILDVVFHCPGEGLPVVFVCPLLQCRKQQQNYLRTFTRVEFVDINLTLDKFVTLCYFLTTDEIHCRNYLQGSLVASCFCTTGTNGFPLSHSKIFTVQSRSRFLSPQCTLLPLYTNSIHLCTQFCSALKKALFAAVLSGQTSTYEYVVRAHVKSVRTQSFSLRS